MIVDSMTYQEIANEYKKDIDLELRYKLEDCFGRFHKYRRFILKNSGENQFYFEPIKYATNRNNTYIIQYLVHSKSHFKKTGAIFNLVYMYYHKPEGIYVAIKGKDDCIPVIGKITKVDTYDFYTPHFFDRYRERYLQNINKPKLQTIIQYFKQNANALSKEVENPKYPNSVFAVSPDGIALGSKISPTIKEYRTFLTYDMLRDKQIELKEDGLNELKNYINSKFNNDRSLETMIYNTQNNIK